jgi:DNA polymerase-3 subunit alpha
LSVTSIQALEDVKVKLPQHVKIRVALERASAATLTELKTMIGESPGPGRVMFSMEQAGEYVVVMEPAGVTVGADRAFFERAEVLLGRGMVVALD